MKELRKKLGIKGREIREKEGSEEARNGERKKG